MSAQHDAHSPNTACNYFSTNDILPDHKYFNTQKNYDYINFHV